MLEASSSEMPCPVLFPPPSLKALKLATAANLLDPTKRICQYEIPGGGMCRNDECEDVHLSRIIGQRDLGNNLDGACSIGLVLCLAHPLVMGLLKSSTTVFFMCGARNVDQDLAQFVQNGLPEDWRRRCSVRSIEDALRGVDRRSYLDGKGTMDLEARVGQALLILGRQMNTCQD
jgi:hypothetical protein